MRLKAKDIAQMLDVSTATVSLVLNNKPGVKEETKAQIVNTIRDLGCDYLFKKVAVPEKDARELGFIVYKRTGDIINDSPFFTYLLEDINSTLLSSGYSLSFLHINKSSPEQEILRQLSQKEYAGFIIFAVEMMEDDLAVFSKQPIPFVCFDNRFPTLNVDTVSINNDQGVHMAFEHLARMGHTRIGYMRSKVRITSFHERFSRYKKELTKRGLPYNEKDVVYMGYSEKDAQNDIVAYIRQGGQLPTAFLADNDILACRAISAFKQEGIKVPDDVSIIGFDNRPICTMTSPTLTTVNVPKDLFGPMVVKNLISKIETNREHCICTEIGTNLVIRESVKDISGRPAV